MGMKVRDKDHGWNRIKREVKGMRKAKVRIGILSNAGNYPADEDGNEASIAEVAYYNEYGTRRGIPERPFIRTTADEKREAYAKQLKAELLDVFAGTKTVLTALERVGAKAQGHVRKKIRDIKKPANAPSTIAAKGSSNPLIDTVTMLRAVNYEVRK